MKALPRPDPVVTEQDWGLEGKFYSEAFIIANRMLWTSRKMSAKAIQALMVQLNNLPGKPPPLSKVKK